MNSGPRTKEYRQGYSSYLSDPECYKNPYGRPSREHNDFERGWAQGIKRYPKQKSKTATITKQLYRREVKTKELSPEQDAIRQAYKNRKS
jgi:hypothetical protein